MQGCSRNKEREGLPIGSACRTSPYYHTDLWSRGLQRRPLARPKLNLKLSTHIIILLYQITIKRNGRRHTHSALTGIRSGRRHTHMTQPNREWRVLIHRTRPARKVRNRAIEDRATHIPRWRQGVAAGQTNKRQQRAQGRLLYTMLCSSQIAKGVHAQCPNMETDFQMINVTAGCAC